MARAVEYTYNIPTDLLCAVMLHESGGDLYAFGRNRNRTYDYGPMQLNSRYLDHFAELYNGGVSFDPYTYDSIRIAGKMLAEKKIRKKTWRKAIQSYNSRDKRYADKVFDAYVYMQGIR